MKAFYHVYRFIHRLRYPVSLPEEIATDLGVSLENYPTFEQFVTFLTSTSCCPTRLCKYMPRKEAEAAFQCALRKEHFTGDSLFSYYFNEGWMEFVLQFDSESRLRRMYVQHKFIQGDRGYEIRIPLFEDTLADIT